MKNLLHLLGSFLVIALISLTLSCTSGPTLELQKGTRIAFVGNNLGSRMMEFGGLETELHLRYPDSTLFIRNLCDPGDTPGFRPRSGTNDPWAFPGAEQFQDEYANKSGSEGFFEKPDQWLTRLQADVVIGFFGFNESFQGEVKLQNFKDELEAWILHSKAQRYNGKGAPQLALVSPIAFEDLSEIKDVPNGKLENENLQRYTEAMEEVAQKHQIVFVDAFSPSKSWYQSSEDPLTLDGSQLTEQGYEKLSELLADKLFGKASHQAEANKDLIELAVLEKNWLWHNDYKIPNGVHVFGRRYDPFGPDNYPFELEKIRQLTAIRDSAIWEANVGKTKDLKTADAWTRSLPDVETNYNPKANGSLDYLYGDDALNSLKVPEGYKIELFASEKEFPDLANPVQLSFDNKGRLWVATMPSYPHYKPGDSRPSDKLLILEDTNGDGKADKETVFADDLHIPVGFELAPKGCMFLKEPI